MNGIGVVGVRVVSQVPSLQVAVVVIAKTINDRGVRLQTHPPLKPAQKNARNLLTLARYASLFKETGVAGERKQIAGVFLRRLERRMRLQTDPTVIYGLGDDYDGDLKRRHLRDNTNPYNTYAIHGLPPTPIALPGEAALRAVVSPVDGVALYFVAKGDRSHAFTATLEEHEENVQRYQLTRRTDYRSSPDISNEQ